MIIAIIGNVMYQNCIANMTSAAIAAITNTIASKINENNTTTPAINPTKILVTFHLNPFVLCSSNCSSIANHDYLLLCYFLGFSLLQFPSFFFWFSLMC